MVMECTRYQRPAAWSLTGDSPVLRARGGWRVLPTAEGSPREKPMFECDLNNIKARLEGAHMAP
jgi:hypothetical protein